MLEGIDWASEGRWLLSMLRHKMDNRRLTLALASSATAVAVAALTAPAKPPPEGVRGTDAGPTSLKEQERSRQAKTAVRVDAKFIADFRRLLRVAFPKLRSRQGVHLLALTALLLVRTALSLKIASLAGTLGRRMVKAEPAAFFKAVLALAIWSVPASLVNSGLKYATALLQVSFRQNISHHFHRRYLTQQTFFRCVGLGAVENVDQRVTEDVMHFADDAASMYSTVVKPIVDICLFSHQVARFGGWKAPGLIIAWYAAVTIIMKKVAAPNFAAMTNQQQRREGALRTGHTHMLRFSEEVVFSRGEDAQRSTLNRLFEGALQQFKYVAYRRASHSVFEGMLVKYGSVMVGYAVCAISNFSGEAAGMSSDQLTGLYIHTSRLLTDLAKAIGALIMTYKTVASLAGYTHRVCELEASISKIERSALKDRQRPSGGAARGQVVVGEKIAFEDVPVVSPDRTTLVEALCFFVKPGMNLLIVGPNGCGKSSTFRLLGELWPLQGGRIEKPSYEHLYYVPQRPYMSSGTLRDQITYPSRDETVSESRLYECLREAGLEEILDRPGIAWDAKLNWAGDALSHGEKQKLAMARLFFHCPRFAILDECSSAVDVDVEQQLYQRCYDRGVTLLTIAHRRSVWRYHNWVLRFDGDGGFMFSPLTFTPEGDLVLSKVQFASESAAVGSRVVVSAAGTVLEQS